MLRKHSKHGFTLVEILIVVILLGILASVVLAMFRPATTDARRAALSENLGILRAQIQLYTLQHDDTSPDLSTTWDPLIAQTADRGGNARGPYLPSIPRNPLNNNTDIAIVATDPAFGDAVSQAGVGYVYNPNNGFIWGTNTAGDKVYNEGNPQDPNN
ncbi:MAG: type II secretion system protein [Planctomycetota bacterium]|nr:type II secretion system protein [Planctomycetota bacterium]